MKYLKFYEAFKSKGISNTIKFIKTKIGEQSVDNFIETLKDFMNYIDFPIDKISDNDIKYMNSRKALQLRASKKVTNQRGIWVIKFWFSLEEGFLGYTATGNNEEEFEDNSEHNGYRSAELFSERELEYIRANVTRTGEIWPVTDYKKLKTGDSVIGQINDTRFENIVMAKIFVDRDDNNRTYAIQAIESGSESDNPDWRQYTQYGDRSWWLYDNNEMGNDHRKLHFFRSSTNELSYVEPPVEDAPAEPEEKLENPLNWNLPLSNRFAFSRWGRGSSISKSSIEKSDFALVLYFDDLINPESDAIHYERPTDIRSQRQQEKEGATKFMTDAEIKKMNIERYIQKLTVSLRITETEFYDLEKIVTKHLSQEFSYISLLIKRPNWTDLSDFSEILYRVVDAETHQKQHYLKRVKDLYSSRTKTYYETLAKYQEAKKYFVVNNDIKILFDEIFRIGLKIFEYFISFKLESIDDLFLMEQKLSSLYNFTRLGRNELSYSVREIISVFRNTNLGEMKNYLEYYGRDYVNLPEDLEKIKRVENYLRIL